MPSETSFIPRLLERADVIIKMKSRHLELDWRREFSLADLSACCERMEKLLPGIVVSDKNTQRELIENPAFAAYLSKLLALLPEEPEKQPEQRPVYDYKNHRYTSPPPRSTPRSPRAELLSGLYTFLLVCQAHQRDITSYPEQSVVDVLSMDELDEYKRLTLLESYDADELEQNRGSIVRGIRNCSTLPLELSQKQKNLLLEPCTASRHLFTSAPFEDVWELLEAAPGVLNIVRLFQRLGVDETLGLSEYRSMAGNTKEFHDGLLSLSEQMDADAFGRFVKLWQRGGCKLHELRRMERWASGNPGQDWENLLANYSGYVNLLYGKRFQRIDLSETANYQENVLIYAIVNRKKHFIRLVDEHAEAFLALPGGSILFLEELYQDHFNLNDLSEKDMGDCYCMMARYFQRKPLAPGRRYTFPELKALYHISEKNFALYHALASGSTDYRLRVFRQVVKGNVMSDIKDDEIGALAAALDHKPLYDWLEQDFSHIAGLTAGDAARMLPHLDELRHLLPGIRTRTDARLALRHVDVLAQYGSIDALKEDIPRIDDDWKALSEMMELSPDFIEAHKSGILAFLCRNGAEIALRYANALGDWQQEAFFRVVKAELMGKLNELKYFEGDLQRELDFPLTMPVKMGWRRNLGIMKCGLEVREHDDFFSTMLLGVQPQRTCLSYIDGQYRECLLSAFDSNKKILYATLDGKIAGRAFLRLTKGRLTGGGNQAETGSFTFVDLENATAPRNERTSHREQVTLFLERPYISGVGPEEKAKIQAAFVDLAAQKADELDVMLVLSQDYRDVCGTGFAQTQYDIYISKSKAGRQYLDSLDGEATVTKEGSYKANTFLVRDVNGFSNACNL